MNRPAPRIAVNEIIARVILEPNGSHQLDVAVPSEIFGMKFSLCHLDQLEAAIAQARAVIAQADGGPDFHNRKVVPLEISR